MEQAAKTQKKAKRSLNVKVKVLKNKIATCRLDGDGDCNDGIPLASAAVANF